MSITYAADTSVSVEKSRAEIETILKRYGAVKFGYMSDQAGAVVLFVINGMEVKFVLPLPDPSDRIFREFTRRGRYTGRTRSDADAFKQWEQACRSKWRSLQLCIKAKLEACNAGITTFEKEFLAHFTMPRGGTIGDRIIPLLGEIQKNGKQLTLTQNAEEFTNI